MQWWILIVGAFSVLSTCIVVLQRMQILQLERAVDDLVRLLTDERAIVARWRANATQRSKQADAGAAALVDLLAWAVDRQDPIPIGDLLVRGQQLLIHAGWSGEYPTGRKAPDDGKPS